jgi:hypothetical protein
MWTRRLLRQLYALEERSTHYVDALEWDELPERCIVQLHTERTPELEELLATHGFRTVVLARHPLDVLISILHFARHEPQTAQWLGGRSGDESTILDADPTSRAFVKYATGPRAKALLSVTPDWWNAADVHLRYEELTGDTRHGLEQIVEALGEAPVASVEEVLTDVTFDALQREATNVHFWQGRADGWRSLLTPRIARKIEQAHREVFVTLGYEVDPDPDLSKRAARARWGELLVRPG